MTCNAFFVAVILPASWAVGMAEHLASAVNMISGITAEEEYCLSVQGGIGVDGAALVLESCAKTVAFGDGRDMFSLQPSGQLLNVPGGKCASVGESEIKEGAFVSLADCESASRWEIQSNGQLKLKSTADYCLTQVGVAPGVRDVAANAAAMASSTRNVASHGAAMAVDGQMKTFWASKFDDTAEPVEFLVDLGGVHSLQSMDIFWEFPARSFSVSLSTDGEHFTEVFATDANVMPTSRMALGGNNARKVRIMMKEPHPADAAFQGHKLYGISGISVYAEGLRAVVSECGKASKSSDARDKYFLSAASEFDESAAKAFRSEVPALEAARAALAASIAELGDALPKLESCGAHAFSRQRVSRNLRKLQEQVVGRVGSASHSSAVDAEDLNLLLSAARSTIVNIRGALA